MQEFISILISFIFMSVSDSIDAAFNNYISIDAVVVCGSLIFLRFVLRDGIGNIGIYTHRTVRKNSSTYLLISGVLGLLLGFITFLFSDVIANLFDLTINQKELLSSILKLYIIYLPISILHIGLLEIVRLNNELKLYRKGLIITYISLIGLDVLAYIFTKNLLYLFIATILSDLICFAYLLYKTKLKFTKPNKDDLRNVKLYGIPYSLERIFSKVLILIYGILASHMGTKNYSIHTICYSVCLTLEIITNAYQATLMIKVPQGKNYQEQYNICISMKNKCFLIVILLNFVLSFLYLFISHGSVPIQQCLPYLIFYTTVVFGLYQYETYKTLCITQGKTLILFVGSLIGVIARLLICVMFLNTNLSLVIFGIANFLDFYFRGLVYKTVLMKLHNKNCYT